MDCRCGVAGTLGRDLLGEMRPRGLLGERGGVDGGVVKRVVFVAGRG